MKKGVQFIVLLVVILIITPLVLAQTAKISVETKQAVYEPGQKVSLKVSLFDSNNAPLNDQVKVVLEDVRKISNIEKTMASNQFVDVDLGEGALSGDWIITATYKDYKANAQFVLRESQFARFDLEGDNLVITNIGNTRYVRTIKIIIGNTASDKNIDLGIGKSLSYRLIAPAGTYNINVLSDGETEIARSNVALTGNVVGILDESASKSTGITGTLHQDEDSFKNKMYVYVFVLAILGAMILLAVERKYRKKMK